MADFTIPDCPLAEALEGMQPSVLAGAVEFASKFFDLEAAELHNVAARLYVAPPPEGSSSTMTDDEVRDARGNLLALGLHFATLLDWSRDGVEPVPVEA